MIFWFVYVVICVLLFMAVSSVVNYYYRTYERMQLSRFRAFVDDFVTYFGLAVVLLFAVLL